MENLNSDDDMQMSLTMASSMGIPLIIDFYTTWCGPCKTMSPEFEKLSVEYTGKAVFVKCDIDQAKDIAENYGIESIPTFQAWKDGNPLGQVVGADLDGLKKMVEEAINTK